MSPTSSLADPSQEFSASPPLPKGLVRFAVLYQKPRPLELWERQTNLVATSENSLSLT